MGLFDWLEVDYPLPNGPEKKTGWQTKSFYCHLDNYRIDENGYLWMKEYFDIFRHEDEEIEWQKQSYHGWANFYAYDPDDDYDDGGPKPFMWYEYNAKFTDGKLVEIEEAEHNDWCHCTACKASGKEIKEWEMPDWPCKRCGKEVSNDAAWRIDYVEGGSAHCDIFCSEECATGEKPQPRWSFSEFKYLGVRGPK